MKTLFITLALLSAICLFAPSTNVAAQQIKLKDSPRSSHTETEGKAYKVRATVKKIYREEMKMTLKHERIKG